MKMSENDHTNSLDPDQALSAKRLEGERSVRFKQCLGKRYSACKELRQKRCYDTCWVYDVTYDHFCSLQQAKVILFTLCTFY